VVTRYAMYSLSRNTVCAAVADIRDDRCVPANYGRNKGRTHTLAFGVFIGVTADLVTYYCCRRADKLLKRAGTHSLCHAVAQRIRKSARSNYACYAARICAAHTVTDDAYRRAFILHQVNAESVLILGAHKAYICFSPSPHVCVRTSLSAACCYLVPFARAARMRS